MKKLLLSAAVVAISLSSQAQDTLFYENFQSILQMNLNSNDMSSINNGANQWIINNSYNGGQVSFYCNFLGQDLQPVGIGGNTTQPNGITGAPTSNYLHIVSVDGIGDGVTNNHFLVPDGFCTINSSENYFAKMNASISTLGYSTVTLSFWWQCSGSATSYGELYYSTNGGTNWTLSTTPLAVYNNNSGWTQTSVSLPAFGNLNSLRFGFRFVNQSGSAADPGFGIDEILITGSQPAANITSDPSSSSTCEGNTVTYSVTATDAVSYQWQGNTGGGFINIPNVPPYSGVNTNTLTISNTTILLSGTTYRCIALNPNGDDTSNVAILTVNSVPAITVTTPNNVQNAGVPFEFNITGHTPGNSYSWDFCDGSTATTNSDSILHTYANAGSFPNCPCVITTNTNGCVDTACYSQTITVNPLDVPVETEKIVAVYPNPASDVLQIQGVILPVEYSILDITGKVQMQATTTDGKISVTKLPSGVYIVRINGNTLRWVKI